MADGVAGLLEQKVKNQARTVKACWKRAGLPAGELNQSPGTMKESIYEDLYELLRLDEIALVSAEWLAGLARVE